MLRDPFLLVKWVLLVKLVVKARLGFYFFHSRIFPVRENSGKKSGNLTGKTGNIPGKFRELSGNFTKNREKSGKNPGNSGKNPGK